jgi:2-methylcitrate dehydratase
LEKHFPELATAIVEVTCKDGHRFTERVDFPKGNPKNRMSDEEILTKFHSNALSVVSEEREKAIIGKIMNLDSFQIPELTRLLVRT